MSKASYYKTVVKKFFLLSLVLFQFTNTNAQNRIGIMAGAGKSSLYNFPGLAVENYSSVTSFWGGITADIPISRHGISLFSTVLYNKKGYSYSLEKQQGPINTVKDSGSSQSLNYVDIHLNLLKKFSWGKSSALFIGAGPTANIFASGSEQTSLTYFGNASGPVVRTQKKLATGNAPGAYKKAFFSLGFKLGFEFDNFKLWVDYNLPLNYYYQDPNSALQYKMKSFGINLGYTLFTGKKKNQEEREKAKKDKEERDKEKKEKKEKEKKEKEEKEKKETALEQARKDSLTTDTDGDGILDKDDKCPGHKGVAKYGGCPVPDADGDGISDDDDKCPMVEGPLSNNGCPLYSELQSGAEKDTMKWIIYFEPGKSELRTEGFMVLNQVIQLLKANKKLVVQFNGHTDRVGSVEANSIRAFSRAMVCVDYVASYYIPRKRLTAAAFSNKKPAADLDDPLLQWKNRRVEVFVFEKDQ